MKFYLTLIGYLLIGFALATPEAEEINEAKIKISLNLTAPDEEKDRFESFVKRELRDLGDVQILPQEAVDADFLITVVLLPVKSRNTERAFVYSCTVIKLFKGLEEFVADDKMYQAILATAGNGQLVHHSLVVNPSSLKEGTESLVADIDTAVFDAMREDGD